MGHRHGRVRFDRWDVSLLRRAPGNRSTTARGRLRFRMPASSGSTPGGFDEAAGKNFRRKLLPRTEARAGDGMTGPELFVSLGRMLGEKLEEKSEFRGETTFVILPADLREVAKFCRDDLAFDYLLDITSVDNFGDDPRFEIVYELYSLTLGVHLRLKLRV